MELLPWEIADTAHALRRSYDRRAGALGVTRAQWRVLAWVNREPGLRQVELADKLDIEPITLCRIIDRLEESGLVTRERDPTDRRAWQLHLTSRADPVLEGLRAIAEELAAEAFAGFEAGEAERMRQTLRHIRDNLASAADARKPVSA